ncbi:class I SAM-dependent DNA methyltransferase [Streptomyces sp. NPDC008001]|uniref:class I SAM-dependent DNA methyltransferase n=1 Tax=Streptomyces sp. NPDC008001 TaxID=3364804 RepID=UPI0036E9716F
MTGADAPDYTAFAAHYDEWFGPAATTDDTVEALAGLLKTAGPGPALELGIGTGRIALPLAARGVEIHGIDASPAMVGQLRAKPGGQDIPVTLGNFSTAGPDAPDGTDTHYALVYVVNGTFAELPTQEAQVDCFANAARRLRAGGLFVLDAHLPEALTSSASSGGRVVPAEGGQLVLRYRETDRAAQHYRSHYVVFANRSTGGVDMHRTTVSFRYAAPGELDLMARMAGLRLRERWGNWKGAPFTSSSTGHISVYERPAREGNADE